MDNEIRRFTVIVSEVRPPKPTDFGGLVDAIYSLVKELTGDGDSPFTRFDVAVAVIGWVCHFIEDEEQTHTLAERAEELYTAFCRLPLDRKWRPESAEPVAEVTP
jgi:hypothetical protein